MTEQNDNREVALRLSGIKKRYVLGQIGGKTLQADIQSWWARKRGKEDPNMKIGQEQRLVGKSFMALNGIDLTIYKGEAVGIIGANGAGKSTMLKLLSRVTAPTEGTIDLYGRVASMLEVGTGFNGEMTGRENIYMNGAILGMTKAEIDSKMEQIIEFSEVRDFIDTPVKRYSSGMYVKLAFSVAAHLDNEIMIMDEVLAVGDMAFQKKCLTKMREAAKTEGRTVLYVSHNMNTIRNLCDRCIVLSQGKVIFDGDVEKAISVYMQSRKDNSVSLSFMDYKRPRWIRQNHVNILQASYVGKQDTRFLANEPIVLKLVWKNLRAVKNIGLRIEIWSMDDVSRCSYLLEDFYSGEKDQIEEATFQLRTDGLVDADYRMLYTFFEKGQNGGSVEIEAVFGLCFNIESPDSEGITWRPMNWGYLRMPDPQIVTMETLNEWTNDN